MTSYIDLCQLPALSVHMLRNYSVSSLIPPLELANSSVKNDNRFKDRKTPTHGNVFFTRSIIAIIIVSQKKLAAIAGSDSSWSMLQTSRVCAAPITKRYMLH